MAYAPERWLGDFVDIRFFLVWRLMSLRDQQILDAGCNAGIMASEIAARGNGVTGLDNDFQALEIYRKLFRDSELEPLTVCGSWNSLMFAKESFDSIVLGWTLYYDRSDANKAATIAGLAGALKHGGSIYFVESNRDCFIQGRGEDCFWTAQDAIAFFESHGFKITEALGWNPLPSLVFWLPRPWKAKIPKEVLKFLYPPGKIIRFFPGWFSLFRLAGKCRPLWKYCRTYYLRAEKT